MLKRKLVVNFPVSGKKHGNLIKDIVVAVNALSDFDVGFYEDNKQIDIKRPSMQKKIKLLKKKSEL